MMEFKTAIERTKQQLLHNAKEVDTGHWQGVPTAGKPDLVTKEILNVSFLAEIHPGATRSGEELYWLRKHIQPNLPWADLHFAERVSRIPSNPGKAYQVWPWWHPDKRHISQLNNLKFTHTYQERYWPKRAGVNEFGESLHKQSLETGMNADHFGIRYEYGDLDDLVSLLFRQPYTRQAWLPIFFPEDTGAVHGGRVPCTLGYQFMLREGKLDMWYIIRSCDYVRHFRDDLYLSAKLLLWVLEQLVERELRSDQPQVWVDVAPGNFHFHCFSMHYHKGDEHLVRDEP